MESKAFFKHDSNARNSAKILRLRDRYEAAGYGVYFMLLERLRDEESHMSDADWRILARDIHESPEMIQSVVEDFGLFEFSEDGTKFWSPEFIRRLGPSDELRATRSEAGRKGAQSRWSAKDSKNGNRMASNGKSMANYSKNGKGAISQQDASLPFGDSKNASSMANNSKIMANDSNCHNSENADMAKLWQNPAQNGKEWQNEGIRGEEEKEIYKEKEKNTFFSKRNGDLSSEETRVRIISKFFFRNWANPFEEYTRLVAYNGTERWLKMSPSEQLDAAELWRQKPEQPRRHDSRFLKVWQLIYNVAAGLDDCSLCESFLDDGISFKTSGQVATLYCPQAVYDFLEGPDNMSTRSQVKMILVPFMKTIKCNKLNYELINQQ